MKRSQRGQMRDKQKEPMRLQNREKRDIKRNKKRVGATLLFLLKDPHSCFKVAFVIHREFSYHSCITMWGPYTIELGLYIPIMSIIKRALGLCEQASWMHRH